MQEKVCKHHMKDISELRVIAAWDELDQHIIDTAVLSSLWLCQSSLWIFRAQTVTCCITLVVLTL